MTAPKKTLVGQVIAFFVSLKLTIACLAFGMVLIVVGTLAQKHMSIDEALERYFRTVFVWGSWPGANWEVPIFPGGFLVGSILLLNLVAAHLYRFRLSWRQTGIVMIHGGLILLLLGELFTAMFQRGSFLRFDEGQTQNYSTSHSETELVIIDRGDPVTDKVVAIGDRALASGAEVQHPRLPFRVRVREFFRFSQVVAPRNVPPGLELPAATQGIGLKVSAVPVRRPRKDSEPYFSAAWVELNSPSGMIGTWLVTSELDEPQTVAYGGNNYVIELRPRRYYHGFNLRLLDFRFDRYAGTQTAKNYSSRVRLLDPARHEDREVLIYMNHPLRHGGFTFYQHSFEQGETTSILQVVQNPSWLLPYISCALVGLGMIFQFGLHLFAFSQRRRQDATPVVGAPASSSTP